MSVSAPGLVVPREQFPSRAFFSLSTRKASVLRPAGSHTASFFWARNAIYHGLRALGLPRGAHVLLPAYLCRAAVEPFEFFGAAIDFYSINHLCQPDFHEIEAKITDSTAAILVCHYFGFPQRVEQFRALCDRHRIALIEDCAHVLTGSYQGRPLGSFGDASVFSRRKFLPIYDGGELWLNRSDAVLALEWQKESAFFTLKVAKSLFDKAAENSSNVIAKSLFWVGESMKSATKRLRRKASDAPLFALDGNQSTFDISLLRQPMSRVSRWVQSHCDVSAIIQARRRNFLFLLENTRELPGLAPLHDTLPDSVCPWVFPVVFETLPDAHLRLQEEGVLAVNWAGVRPPSLRPKAFPEADWIYDHLVFLPLHQNIGNASSRLIARAVRKVAASSRRKVRTFVFVPSSEIA
jgi:perosamine synthetase